MMDSQMIIYVAGNQLVLLDLKLKTQQYLRSTSGGGIGVISVRNSVSSCKIFLSSQIVEE